MESTFEKIIRKSGKKPISCKCEQCKNQCRISPCLGTPADIEKIIDAGYGNKIFLTTWAAGVLMGVTSDFVMMYQAEMTDNGCAFLVDGLCSLHDLGLKPTEGRLSHHTQEVSVLGPASKNLPWLVAKEWLDPANEQTILRIHKKLER